VGAQLQMGPERASALGLRVDSPTMPSPPSGPSGPTPELLHPAVPSIGGGDEAPHEGAAAGNRPAVDLIGEADIRERETGAIRVDDLPGPAAIGGALDQTANAVLQFSSHGPAVEIVDERGGGCRTSTSS